MQNPSERATIERLADVAGMSARNLTRVFRQVTGISINEFSTRVRVELARTLLHDPTLTMDAVAQRCGARQLRRLLRASPLRRPAATLDD